MPQDPHDQFDARGRIDSYDHDSIPLGAIIWRFRRLLAAGAVCGTLVGFAYLLSRPATTSYEFFVGAPTTVTVTTGSPQATQAATVSDTALLIQLAASEILGAEGSAQVSAKAADRNGRLVRVTLLFPESTGSQADARELAVRLVEQLAAVQGVTLDPARSVIQVHLDRLSAALTAAEQERSMDVPLEVLTFQDERIQRLRREVFQTEALTRAIMPSTMIGSPLLVEASSQVARSAGIVVGLAVAMSFAALAMGWLAREIREAAGREG